MSIQIRTFVNIIYSDGRIYHSVNGALYYLWIYPDVKCCIVGQTEHIESNAFFVAIAKCFNGW